MSERPEAASPPTLRAVLFDATGTLIELRESVGERYARTAARHGVSLPAWRIDDAFRRVVARAAPRVFPETTGDPRASRERERDWWRMVVRDTFRATDQTVRFPDFEAFFEELFEGYAGAGAWALRPGARETLQRLHDRDLRLGVVSDFDHRLTRILEELEIAEFFQAVVLPGPEGLAKPSPEPFENALEALGVSAPEAVYVGDDPERDLAGARAAGLAALDVRELADLTELPARLATLPLPADPETR